MKRYQNIVKLALEAQDYEDEDIINLRDQKAHKLRMEKESALARERMERFARYFYGDGTCQEHDRNGCNECRHYARGGCPSYWEERY